MNIHNDCCLDYLTRTQEEWDIVITSPPYNMNLRVRGNRYQKRWKSPNEISTKYEHFNDDILLDKFYDFHKKVLTLLIEKSDLIFYNISIVTGSKKAFFKLIGDFSHVLKDVIIWHKPQGSPAMNRGVMNRKTEHILIFDKNNSIQRVFKKRNFSRGTLDDIWKIKREINPCEAHKATFPLELPSKILRNFSTPADRVLDPFMGTGTTGIAAYNHNCFFTGIEIEKNTFEYAKKRNEQHTKQLRLF